jgi:glycosyltransferase involved in cell wall biosynthesis
MKILHCIYDHIRNPWVAGGGAVRVHEIYRRLAGRHEITVVCGAYPGSEDYTENNVHYRFEGTRRNNYILSTFCYAALAARHIKNHAGAYDIVVEDFAPYNPVFSFIWHKDAVIQLHQREGPRHLKKYAFLGIPFFLIEKFYHRFFKNAVSESDIGRDSYKLRGRVGVISNGFDPKLLSLEPEEDNYALFLGRLHINQKGLDTLYDALPLFGCKLIIGGGGKDEQKVQALFRDAVINGRTRFAGYVRGREKEELLRRCLFVVVPSRYEGQPVTIVESAACGKPVIVSDIPELQYAVNEGFGLSFKAGDAADLAKKANLLLESLSLRKTMGMKGREYAGNFTWDRVAEKYEQYLQGIPKETSS